MVSKHITYYEATKSITAIRNNIINKPNKKQLANMKLVAKHCFEPIREHFDTPIGITSFFRCQELNTLVKGSINSQHTTGQAIDIDADIYGVITNIEIFYFIMENLCFDQLIFEYGDNTNPAWVHVSYSETNRCEVLKAIKGKGYVYF